MEPEQCAIFDCDGAATAGSVYCWAHEELRKKKKLVVTEASKRNPSPRPLMPIAPYASLDMPRQICRYGECERYAEPGSVLCRRHRRESVD